MDDYIQLSQVPTRRCFSSFLEFKAMAMLANESIREVRFDPSSSGVVWGTVKGSHLYTVKGFSLTRGWSDSSSTKFLSSSAFTVGGYEWRIIFVPEYRIPSSDAVYVAAFVRLLSRATDVQVRLALTLHDQSGRGKHKKLEGIPMVIPNWDTSWGFKDLRRDFIENSVFLKDDALVLHCIVEVFKARYEIPMPIFTILSPPPISQFLREVLESGASSDVIFEVKNETFKAHKFVLACSSPVFETQFFDGNTNTDKVIIEDIDPAVFKSMLIFLYSGVLPDLLDLTESKSPITLVTMVQHLLEAADRYGLDILTQHCEAKLCEYLTIDTLATIWGLAYQHDFSKLKSICINFAAARENLEAVMKTKGFEDLKSTCPSMMLDLVETIAKNDQNNDPMDNCIIELRLFDSLKAERRLVEERL